jgi:hypothetical protein
MRRSPRLKRRSPAYAAQHRNFPTAGSRSSKCAIVSARRATTIRKLRSKTMAPSLIPSRIFSRALSEAACCGISCDRATGLGLHVAGRTSALLDSPFPFLAPTARLTTPQVEIGGTPPVAAAGRQRSRLRIALDPMTRTSPRAAPSDRNRQRFTAKFAKQGLAFARTQLAVFGNVRLPGRAEIIECTAIVDPDETSGIITLPLPRIPGFPVHCRNTCRAGTYRTW